MKSKFYFSLFVFTIFGLRFLSTLSIAGCAGPYLRIEQILKGDTAILYAGLHGSECDPVTDCQWYRNDTIILGANKDHFKTNTFGKYTATIKINGTISTFSLMYNKPIKTGTNVQAEKNPIELFPNPAKDVLNLKLPELSEDLKVELFDVLGKTNISLINPLEKNLTLNVSELPRGLYFLKVTDRNGAALKKLILH